MNSSLNKSYRLLFFGSDSISQKVLTHIKDNSSHPLKIVCPPYRKPRTPLADLHEYIKKQQVPIVQEFHSKDQWPQLEELINGNQYDVGVVASFGHMIPDQIINQFNNGMFVVHPSLLPKYRGSCPIQHAILNQESKTGVSIIEISKNQFDAGAILYKESIDLNEDSRFDEVSKKLSDLGGKGVLKVLSDLEYHRANKILQEKSQVTSARMIKPEFGIIKFSELSAIQAQVRFNALYGSNTRPKAVAKEGFHDKFLNSPVHFDRLDRVKFEKEYEREIIKQELEGIDQIPEGSIHWNQKKCKERVFIKCKGDQDQWVQFGEITLTGVGKVKAYDFMMKIVENKPYNKTKNPHFKYLFE